MAGLAHRLTSYVARHSWASMAYHANIDLSVISKALGHTSPNTTLTYIREIDDQRIDQANHLLLNQIT
jgi:integrase